MDFRPPGSSVYRILQERILEWVAIHFSRGHSSPRGEPTFLLFPTLPGGFFTTSATWEAPFSTTVVEWQQVRVKWIWNQNLELLFQINALSDCILSLLLLSSQQRFEAMNQSYSSVTTQNFIKQTAKRTLQEMRAGQPWKSLANSSWLPLFIIFPSSPEACFM